MCIILIRKGPAPNQDTRLFFLKTRGAFEHCYCYMFFSRPKGCFFPKWAANNPLSVCGTIQYRKHLFLTETHGCFFPQQGPNPWKNSKAAAEDTSLSNFWQHQLVTFVVFFSSKTWTRGDSVWPSPRDLVYIYVFYFLLKGVGGGGVSLFCT
jgi:hypothetical protein